MLRKSKNIIDISIFVYISYLEKFVSFISIHTRKGEFNVEFSCCLFIQLSIAIVIFDRLHFLRKNVLPSM